MRRDHLRIAAFAACFAALLATACGNGATPAGKTASFCPRDLVRCGDTCVDLQTNRGNCGECGTDARHGEAFLLTDFQ